MQEHSPATTKASHASRPFFGGDAAHATPFFSPLIQRKCVACEEEAPKLQTKLSIGAPGDRFEKEADAVADTVMRFPDTRAVPPVASFVLPMRIQVSETSTIPNISPAEAQTPRRAAVIARSQLSILPSLPSSVTRSAPYAPAPGEPSPAQVEPAAEPGQVEHTQADADSGAAAPGAGTPAPGGAATQQGEAARGTPGGGEASAATSAAEDDNRPLRLADLFEQRPPAPGPGGPGAAAKTPDTTGVGGRATAAEGPVLSEVAAQMETLATRLETAMAETRANLQTQSSSIRSRVRQQAAGARAGIRAEVERAVSGIQAGQSSLLSEVSSMVSAAHAQIDTNLAARKAEATQTGRTSQQNIRGTFSGHRVSVERTVSNNIAAAERMRTDKAEEVRRRNRADIRTAFEKGGAKMRSYPNTNRGAYIGVAAFKVAEGTANKMGEQEPEIISAVNEVTAPLPQYFREQGTRALEGFDVNLPQILRSVDSGVAQAQGDQDRRAREAHARLNAVADQTRDEICGLAGEAIGQARAFGPQLEGQLDQEVEEVLRAIAAAPRDVMDRISQPIQEAVVLFRTREDPDVEAATDLTDGLVVFLGDSVSSTVATMERAAETSHQRFQGMRGGARQAMRAQVERSDKVWQGARAGFASTVTAMVSNFDAGFASAATALRETLTGTEQSIRDQLAPIVSELDGSFLATLRDSERQIDGRIDEGLSKNTEALNELDSKMEEAADDAAFEWDHPVLSALSFIAGILVGIITVLALVALLIAASWVIAAVLGVSMLAAGLILIAGMAAFSIGFAFGARLAAGQGVGEAFLGAVGDFARAVPGMLYDMTGIPKLRRAFSDERMTPYQRGKLIGEGGTELVLAIFLVRGAAKGVASTFRNLPRFRPPAIAPEPVAVPETLGAPRPLPEPAAASRPEPGIGFGHEAQPRPPGAQPQTEPRIGFGREAVREAQPRPPGAQPQPEPRIGFGREALREAQPRPPGAQSQPEPRIGFGREAVREAQPQPPGAQPQPEPRIGFGREAVRESQPQPPGAQPQPEPRIGFGREAVREAQPLPEAQPQLEPRIGFGREPGVRPPASEALAAAEGGPPVNLQGPAAMRQPVAIESGPPAQGPVATVAAQPRAGGQSPLEVRASSEPPGSGGARPGRPAAGGTEGTRPARAGAGGRQGPGPGLTGRGESQPTTVQEASPQRPSEGVPVEVPASAVEGGSTSRPAAEPTPGEPRGRTTAGPQERTPGPGDLGTRASGRPRATPEPDTTPPSQAELARARALGDAKPPRFTRLGDVWRWLRYKAGGGQKEFSEWVTGSRGSRRGGPNHQAIQDRLVANGGDPEVPIGSNAADARWPKGTNGAPRDTYHQIGELNKVRGDPINRERLNFEDMFNYFRRLGQDVELWFWDRNNPGATEPAIKVRTDRPLSQQPDWNRAVR